MTDYKIINVEVIDDTIHTEVEYTMKGLFNKKTVIVASFRPNDKEEIVENIIRRQESEQYQIDNKEEIERLAKEKEEEAKKNIEAEELLRKQEDERKQQEVLSTKAIYKNKNELIRSQLIR